VKKRLHIIILTIISLYAVGYGSLEAQTKRAFLVGISEYTSSLIKSDSIWSNIHGTNDVELLSKTLSNQGFREQLILKNQNATAKNIRLSFDSLSKNCKSGDTVYIHFSCHGQPFEDVEPFDEEDGWDESLVPVDALMVYGMNRYKGENHILDDELNAWFQTLRKKIGCRGLLIAVLDACHTGTAFRGEDKDDEIYIRGTRIGFSPTGKKFCPRIDTRGNILVIPDMELSDICVLEACRSYQVNAEIRQNGNFYGPLSYYVNEVFKKYSIDDLKWVEDVRRMMQRDIRLIRQNPVIETSF